MGAQRGHHCDRRTGLLNALPRRRVSQLVDLFLQFGGGSITLMDRKQGADVLYELAMRIGQKMQEFRESTKTLAGLEEFNLDWRSST
ncbi:hypothetical protein MRB53_026742 [Persea americana]|uniref:Uncharacterized protein n=1 Tax=Persea americana TaxID=3435 RepID=A0ACC2LIZ8_PERAE|nr:hypothetical protein MRB53_026742 [Persea americana]